MCDKSDELANAAVRNPLVMTQLSMLCRSGFFVVLELFLVSLHELLSDLD
jgi:hypothetical protein